MRPVHVLSLLQCMLSELPRIRGRRVEGSHEIIQFKITENVLKNWTQSQPIPSVQFRTARCRSRSNDQEEPKINSRIFWTTVKTLRMKNWCFFGHLSQRSPFFGDSCLNALIFANASRSRGLSAYWIRMRHYTLKRSSTTVNWVSTSLDERLPSCRRILRDDNEEDNRRAHDASAKSELTKVWAMRMKWNLASLFMSLSGHRLQIRQKMYSLSC